MAINTGGFSVPVMPNIQFADGAQLAGRGPGEAIAGFNSGIGAVDAINNARNKQILAPIQQDEARARLAQINAQTQLELAQAPYRQALARIEAGRASIPFRSKQGESVVKVPRLDAQGKPTGDYDTQIIEHGQQYNTSTDQMTPYTAQGRVLSTAEQDALNQAIIGQRQALSQHYQAGDQNLQFNQGLNLQKADILAQNAAEKNRHNVSSENLRASGQALGNYGEVTGLDANGNLVLVPYNKRTGASGTAIPTQLSPNRAVDPFALKPGAPIVAPPPASTDQGTNPILSGASKIGEWLRGNQTLNSIAGNTGLNTLGSIIGIPRPGAAPASQASTLPDVPAAQAPQAIPASQAQPGDRDAPAEDSDLAIWADQVSPPPATPAPATKKAPFSIVLKKP